MTIDELLGKLPDELQPWGLQYGPAILGMGSEGIKKWIERLIAGDVEGAYREVLDKMDSAEVVSEWDSLNEAWAAENADNADRIELQKSALTGLVRVLLVIALAAVGL